MICIRGGAERDHTPISMDGVADLRRILLRTLNDNQLMILSRIAVMSRSLTSIVRELNALQGIPLSTLKLNARILREYNLISYGDKCRGANAEILPLGRFILKLVEEEQIKLTMRFDD